MLLSSLCFAIMSAIAKEMSHTFSSIQLVFFRSAVGLPFLLTSLYRRPAIQTGGKLYFIILRGLLGAFTLYCLFYTLEHLGLSLTIPMARLSRSLLRSLASFYCQMKA